jgi:hypothetical protein
MDSTPTSASTNTVTSGGVYTALSGKADTSSLATVATTGAYSDLSGTPTVDQTYDGTSANAQSGVAVASAISGKADDSAVVHLTGDETITGGKTFTSNIIHKNTKATISNPPTSNSWLYTDFIDNNNARIGVIGSFIKPNGSRGTYLQAGNEGDVSIVSNGSNAWATAPASDVNGSIVTTVTKTKNGNGGFKFGNGLIINFGHISSTNWSSDAYDVVYSIPFTTYGRIGFCRTSAATTKNDGGDYYARNPTTTGFNAYRTVTNTASIDWVAIGY